MASKKWLNIIVDGNSALGPFWPTILSDCVEKIVRTFFDCSRNEEANHEQRQVGLVMYNANSEQGLDVQYINWTREVNDFLAMISSLVFNGNNENQHTLVQGLAQALVMFPKPSNVMTTEEYYNGTRHCILVVARDPIPRRIPVSVPEINQGRTTGTQLYTLNADFYEVAEMFGPLATSLSIISPVQHPMFEVIYNMGNYGSLFETTPVPNIRIGQLNVMLSGNFTEAHDTLCGKRIMDPPTNDIRFPIDFADDNQDLFSIVNMMMMGEGINEAAEDSGLILDQEAINRLPPDAPYVSTSAVGISTPPVVFPNAPTSTAREGLTNVQEERGKGVLVDSSETISMGRTFGVGMADPRGPPPADYSSGNSFNTETNFSPPMISSVTTINSSSYNRRSRLPFLAAGFDLYGRPFFGPTGVPPAPVTPQFKPADFWPPQPSATNSPDLVQAWHGTMIAKTHRSRKNIHRGMAHRRATSPSTLTAEWSSRLEIALYLPQKALDYTITIFRGPIEYVFFHMLHFNNLDLYDHLKKNNLCAKVNLRSQTLIIAPTRDKHYYIGTIFPSDITFIQMT